MQFRVVFLYAVLRGGVSVFLIRSHADAKAHNKEEGRIEEKSREREEKDGTPYQSITVLSPLSLFVTFNHRIATKSGFDN